MIFANSLDSDQDRQNVSPDLDPNLLALRVLPKCFFEKVNFEKKSAAWKITWVKLFEGIVKWGQIA